MAEPTSRPDLDANKLANMRLENIKHKRLTDMELSKEGSPDRIWDSLGKIGQGNTNPRSNANWWVTYVQRKYLEERCHLHLPESTHNECLNQKRSKHEIARTLGMGEGKRITHYWKNPYVNIPEETKINHHVKCIIQYDVTHYSATTMTTAT